MIALGVPYVALGNVHGDSGFIEILEPLQYMHKTHGVKSMIYVDKYFERAKKIQIPEETGVSAVCSDREQKPRLNSYKWGFGESIAFSCLPGSAETPVDFIFTNRKFAVPCMSIPCLDSKARRSLVPIILDVLKVGLETHDKVSEKFLETEALAYMYADRIIFSTQREFDLGMRLAKRYLSSYSICSLKEKSRIYGDGISDELKKPALSDDAVVKKLTQKRETIRMAYIGRMNSNKGIERVVAVVRPLYALTGMKLTVVSPSQMVPERKGLNCS